jgi:hypothetical protein
MLSFDCAQYSVCGEKNPRLAMIKNRLYMG